MPGNDRHFIPIPVGVLAFLGLMLTLSAAEGLPYGHQDFVPTPERPIFFRPNNGHYPGATPPLEWWEGTPAKVKVRIHDRRKGEESQVEGWDCTDTKAKNILWKVPVPGWSLSHPVVVGKRVFAVGEPDFVTCYDADTGTVLWQRRIMPLLCDGLSEEKAAAGQKVIDLARALFLTTNGYAKQAGNVNNFGTKDNPSRLPPERIFAERVQFAAKLVAMIRRYRPDVEVFADPDLLAAADKDLAVLTDYTNAKDLADLEAKIASNKARGVNHLEQVLEKKYGVTVKTTWMGYVGRADSTLASDGKRIFGVFNQGQICCLDLDGKTIWLQREKGPCDNRSTFHRSPLLCGGLLLVRNMVHDKKKAGCLRAFDATTGALRWESPLAISNYTVPRLMRLNGSEPSGGSPPGGQAVDVVLADAPESKERGLCIVRVSDGKILGHLPPHDCGRGAVMGIFGDQVTWTSTSDQGGGPTCSYRLTLAGSDAMAAEKVFVLGETDKKERIFYNQANFPAVAGTAWLYRSQLFDAVCGRLLTTLPAKVEDCAVVAGHYLIAMADSGASGNEPWGRARADRKTLCRFVVFDLTDPAKPVLMSDRNLLGYPDPPADYIITKYLSEFDPYDFVGNDKGSQSYFAMMSGPVPHGDRLYLQSSAFLYCIGRP